MISLLSFAGKLLDYICQLQTQKIHIAKNKSKALVFAWLYGEQRDYQANSNNWFALISK